MRNKAKFLVIFTILIIFSNTDFALASNSCEAYFEKYEIEYDLPPHILAAIGTQESGKGNGKGDKNPWPWTVNFRGKSYYFQNKKEAIDFVSAKQKRGIKSIDVGCMQINLKHHPKAFKNVEQAFEPQYNVEYAAKLLREIYNRKHHWMDTVATYHSGNFHYGNIYATKIAKVWKNILENNGSDYAYLNEIGIELNINKTLSPKVQNSIKQRIESNSLKMEYLF